MRTLSFAMALVLAFSTTCFADGAPTESGFDSTHDERSYALGMDLGQKIKAQDYDVNPDMLLKGFADVLKGQKTRLDQAQVVEVMQNFRQDVMKKRMADQEAKAANNLEQGKAFLEANKDKEGVQVTSTGLQYKVLKEGEGESPAATDTVTVHYKGTLLDGTEFDSSYKRGQPATFPLNGVIPGWTAGLQLMKPGAKYMFYIPSNLAYGPRQVGQHIGPNATLIFEVELLEVKKDS